MMVAGINTLYYKVPTKPGAGLSKLWTDQTAACKFYFIGRVSTASCGLATGAKQVCRLGDLPPLASLPTRGILFSMPTSSMTNPHGYDKSPAWMVRVLKTKDVVVQD